MNRKKIIKTLNYVVFLGIGIFLFYLVYKDMELDSLKAELKNIKYGWIILSFLIGILSHISRAIRWNMLIKPLGYNPRIINSFLSVMVMYLTNLAVPRVGEVIRCSVLTKYEKVPFSKLIGTVIVERLTDTVALAVFAAMIILSQFGAIKEFFLNNPQMGEGISNLLSTKNILLAVAGFAALIILIFIFREALKKTKFYKKITDFLKNIVEGLKTIAQLENKWYYIGHTVFIYLMWLISLYVIFFSYPPTAHLGISAASVALVMGALSMIAPIQGGIGAWHFMVSRTLLIYGIALVTGEKFALIAHTSTFYVFLLVFGLISLILIPIVNRNYTPEPVEGIIN